MAWRSILTGPEKPMLHAMLDKQRDVMVWKLHGLDQEQSSRPMTPSGTSLLGMVKHLADVEYGWFCETFGRPTEPLPYNEDEPDAVFRIESHETTEDILAFYQRARQAADAAIEELDLDTEGNAGGGAAITLRWVILHMIEETARHAGHADVIRELLDGTTGYLPPRN